MPASVVTSRQSQADLPHIVEQQLRQADIRREVLMACQNEAFALYTGCGHFGQAGGQRSSCRIATRNAGCDCTLVRE
jgi:hypothetical protein